MGSSSLDSLNVLSLIDYLLSEEVNAEFSLDPFVRLEGSDGCASETLHWLIKGLRLKDKFTESIYPLRVFFLKSWGISIKIE